VTSASELWGFGAARDASRRLAPLYREAAAQAGATFLDAGGLVRVDPADGVHLAATAHGVLGAAIAAEVERLLDEPSGRAR
jgi:lysophospholipase L1-like esterase